MYLNEDTLGFFLIRILIYNKYLKNYVNNIYLMLWVYDIYEIIYNIVNI